MRDSGILVDLRRVRDGSLLAADSGDVMDGGEATTVVFEETDDAGAAVVTDPGLLDGGESTTDDLLYVNDLDFLTAEIGELEVVGEEGESDIVVYDDVDDDTDAISVVSSGPTHTQGENIYSTPESYTVYAHVQLNDGGEPVIARVPQNQIITMPEPSPTTVVVIEYDEESDEWVVFDVAGGTPVIDGGYVTPGTLPTGDGEPPASSPTPSDVSGGPGWISVRWNGVENADATYYEVHISTSEGFTPDGPGVTGGTLAGVIAGTILFIRSMPNGDPLEYPTETEPNYYYVRLVAFDGDGHADPGSEVAVQLTQVNHEDISADSIYAEQIYGAEINAGHLNAEFEITNTLIAGASENQHVEITAEGVRLYPAGIPKPAPIIDLPTDPNSNPQFQGVVNASGLDVSGDATLRGAGSTIEPDAALTLQAAPSGPVTAPAAVIAYPEEITLEGGALHYGLFYDAAGGPLGDTPSYWTTQPVPGGGLFRIVAEYDASDGSLLRSIDLGQGNDAWGVCRIGDYIYILWSPNDTTIWNLSKREQADVSNIIDEGTVSSYVKNDTPGLFTDGTDAIVITTANDQDVTHVRLVRFDADTFDWISSQTLDSSFRVDGRGGNKHMTEFGGAVLLSGYYYIAMYSWRDASWVRRGVFAFDSTTGAYDVTKLFYGYNGAEADGICYDGSKFHTLVDATPVIRHTDWFPTGDPYWAAYTWADSSDNETTVSPSQGFTGRRRAGVKVTAPLIPPGDPDHVNIYASSKATVPGDSEMHLQAELAAGILETVLETYNPAGAVPPTTNELGSGGTPAVLKSDSGGLEMRGDGTLILPTVTTAVAGSIRWNAGTQKAQVYTGSVWADLN